VISKPFLFSADFKLRTIEGAISSFLLAIKGRNAPSGIMPNGNKSCHDFTVATALPGSA